jgi:2-oxoglutarate ferredoxin oxidoreductase subunit beta
VLKYTDYINTKALPFIWCPGCGDGIVVRALAEVFAGLAIPPHQIVIATGIGCWGKADDYFNTHAFHGSHGRAIAFATGIKAGNPELHVVVLMGDGDAVAIGGNHFIHAARRNMALTAVVVNNYNYGMTGGQYSPTSPLGSHTTTSPRGVPEPPFDLCALAVASGANFVARTTVYHVTQLQKMLKQALTNKGFGVVEVLSPCPTHFGRRNFENPLAMMHYLKDRAVPAGRYAEMDQAGKEAHFPTGVFAEKDRPDFLSVYEALNKAQGGDRR